MQLPSPDEFQEEDMKEQMEQILLYQRPKQDEKH